MFRWNHILIVVLASLPFVALIIFGLVFLIKEGWIVYFLITALTVNIVGWSIRWLASRKRNQQSTARISAAELEVEPDPEWTQPETHAYTATVTKIHQMTKTTLAWEALPKLSLEVIEEVAKQLGGSKRKPLDFTTPEVLLLIEKTASRYREHLRKRMPYSDQVSVSKIVWVWKNRKNLNRAWFVADNARRIASFAVNPAAAIVKEFELLVASKNINYLSDQTLATLQAVLLEEVATAAIDLYSGRLKYSDDELLNIELASTRRDLARIAVEDDPLRIMFTGQTSAGKSSLLNNLLRIDAAETDVIATTDSATNYISTIQNTSCHLIDTPGNDGTTSVSAELLEEMTHSDIVIWLIRADRPSRASDVELYKRFKKIYSEQPHRRMPMVLFVISFIDRLSPQWPHPENNIPVQTMHIFESVKASVTNVMEVDNVVAISNSEPNWNINVVADWLETAVEEGLMVQRNRRRHTKTKKLKGFIDRTKGSITGVARGAKFIGSQVLKRRRQSNRGEKDPR